jgi:hypothetical protein
VSVQVTDLVPAGETRLALVDETGLALRGASLPVERPAVAFVSPSGTAFVLDGRGRVVAAWRVTRWRRRLARSIYWPVSEEWTREPARVALVIAGLLRRDV